MGIRILELCTTTSFLAIGIPPESITKIFDRFCRVDESRTIAIGGTSLRRIVPTYIIDKILTIRRKYNTLYIS